MLISVKHDFVILSTPKCASNSVEAMLQPFSDISLVGPPYFRHTNFRRYDKFIKPYIYDATGGSELETICLIREPLSWLYSHYRFRTRFQLRNPNHPNFSSSTHKICFSEYAIAYMSENPPPYADVRCQFDFVRDEMSETGVQNIFLYENIDEFIQYMSKKVGSALNIGFKNVSPKSRNKSNLVELVDYASQKVVRSLNWKPSPRRKEFDYPLTDELVDSLRNFMADDFTLYHRVKESQ